MPATVSQLPKPDFPLTANCCHSIALAERPTGVEYSPWPMVRRQCRGVVSSSSVMTIGGIAGGLNHATKQKARAGSARRLALIPL